MPRTSPSAVLTRALRERGLSQSDLARELKVFSGVVSNWVNGRRTPGLHSALRLQEILGIDPAIWAQPKRKSA